MTNSSKDFLKLNQIYTNITLKQQKRKTKKKNIIQ